ncbi:MAG: SNF2-related protein [Cypionkella sp.]
MENAATLTPPRIDLLPHQVVLTHRIANAAQRRFLIADEVGLGKTIETALILRELASRGEINRALMIVPAGLVNNWHRELNEVFNLNFEEFGTDGDVTDRKSNAFAKHNRLIASVDTLETPNTGTTLARRAEVGPCRVRRGPPPLRVQDRQERSGRQRTTSSQRRCGIMPRPAAPLGHASPGRPFPVLDAHPAAQPDSIR